MRVFQNVNRILAKVLLFAILAMVAGINAANAAWPNNTKPKALHMLTFGNGSTPGQKTIASFNKDALDMANWAATQKGKPYQEVHVAPTLLDSQATGTASMVSCTGISVAWLRVAMATETPMNTVPSAQSRKMR